MAKKKSSSGSSTRKRASTTKKISIPSLILVAVVLLILFIGDRAGVIDVNWDGLLFGATPTAVAEQNVVTSEPTERSTTQSTSVPESAPSTSNSSDDWYQLYFTSPQYPDVEETRVHTVENALIDVINHAEKSLDIAIYELDLDTIGDAILAAEKRGVTVRMVTDSDTLEEDETLIRLNKAKVPIVPDERGAIMHNKFVVVDGKAVWTGSWNFTNNCTFRNNNSAIYIQSPELAQNYAVEFAELFERGEFGPRSTADTPNPVVEINGTRIETCFAPEDECGDHLAELLKTAQKSIHFMAFSFTHEDIGKAVRARAKDGVLVRGVFETRGSDTEYSEFGAMKKAKLDVIQDGNPYTMHHKVFIIDEKIVVMGSFNFSSNADDANDENYLVIYNAEIAKKYMEEFERVYEVALNPPNK